MEFFEHGYALIIGIGAYQHLPPLAATATAARSISAVLQDPRRCAYRPAHVTTLLDGAATNANILNALDALSTQTSAESTVIIYFAGHAGQWQGPFHTQQLWLCPVDATAKLGTALAADTLRACLGRIVARHVLILLDCYAANPPIKQKDPAPAPDLVPLNQAAVDRLSSDTEHMVLAATDLPQAATHAYQHSAFTQLLFAGLYGDLAPQHPDQVLGCLDLLGWMRQPPAPWDLPPPCIISSQPPTHNHPIALYQGCAQTCAAQPAPSDAPAESMAASTAPASDAEGPCIPNPRLKNDEIMHLLHFINKGLAQ